MNYFKLKTQWLNKQTTWMCYLSDVGQWVATPYTFDSTSILDVIEKIKTLNPTFSFQGVLND